jgi:hypothetical protein
MTLGQTPAASNGTHAERQRRLRLLLADARQRRDTAAEQIIAEWLDAGYVAQSHKRADDSEIRRLRRLVRQSAA